MRVTTERTERTERTEKGRAAVLSVLSVFSCPLLRPHRATPGRASRRRRPAARRHPAGFLGPHPNFKGDVEFQFDEVISEGSAPDQGAGTGGLEKLIILSPTVEIPSVSWRRTKIAVHPDEG